MSFSRYALGLALLVVVTASIAVCGVGIRRRWLPHWTGVPARLAEAIAAVTSLLAVAELLGAVGLLRMPFVVGGIVLLGLTVVTMLKPSAALRQPSDPGPLIPAYAVAIAVAASILVIAQWAASLGPTFHGGMTGPDTLAYHGPIAATFVQRASIVHPPYINTDPTIAFFPMTSELIDALGIVLFSRDILTPYVNLAWLALAALAAWCIGRPRGAGASSVLVALVLLDAPMFSTSQPSSGDNDVMALALLMSSLALLFSEDDLFGADGASVSGSPAVVALAGAAAGFALATKVTMFAPVGLLAIAVVIALSGVRNRVVWIFGVIAASGVWFVRNLIAFGNPVPEVRLGVGPLAFPSAHVPTGATVADYVTDERIWRELFLPALHTSLTSIWPVILVATLVGAVGSMACGRTRLDRMLGMVAVLSAVAYALTPRTGFLFLVAINLRYLGPALVFGLMLLYRLPITRLLARPWILAPLGAALVLELANAGIGDRLDGVALLGVRPHFAGTSVMWLAIALAAAATWLVAARSARRIAPWVVLVALGAVGLALWPSERTYERTRYAAGSLAFARPLKHKRIAVVGYLQAYPAFGLRLSNVVTEIFDHGPHGSQTQIRSCRAWRRALNAGHFDYVVTSPPYRLVFTSAPDYPGWTRTDPAAKLVGAFPDGIGGYITVFRLHGSLHPGLCS